MKIVDLHFYTGRNIYSHYPVLSMLLDLETFRIIVQTVTRLLPTAYLRAADIRGT